MEESISYVLTAYGLDPASFRCERIGQGHIHDTYRIVGQPSFVLQRFNDKVFVRPEVVERNIRLTADHLREHFPDYLFVAPLPSPDGRTLVFDKQDRPWRLFNYVTDSYAIDEATSVDQAFKAAAAFGKLGKLLRDCRVADFSPTIDRFHDLSFRYEQFKESLQKANADRKQDARREIDAAEKYSFLVSQYETIISNGRLTQGIFHNDTKINNVLFHAVSHNVAAVVDLDTLMPGYFIYDLGDLIRTIVSPVSEEEKDLNRVQVRNEFYQAVVDGYLSEMKEVLSEDELNCVAFSGQMMTYIMALRFLADYLRGDTYYHTTYPGQNLVRAKNQFRLLALLVEKR
jgi:Ser/Thr protein kinase RdoA (MazF antagonist)